MRFTKMQGLGNDYLYVYGETPENVAEISRRLSDRHFGAGSDGMIFISPSKVADFKMRIFNADGSEAKMCGNGIRCVGKYVYDKGFTDKTAITVETLSGVKTLDMRVENGAVKTVTVDMSEAVVSPEIRLKTDDGEIVCTPVSVGNPHVVSFVGDADAVAIEALGPQIEHDESFPGGVNAEFVTVKSPRELRMRVWERGSGVTMACGTGACASVAAAVARGYSPAGETVVVHLDGGTLEIIVSKDGSVTMTGPAEFVFEGECDLC